MFFWNSLFFLMIHRMLAIWSLVPLPFLKPAWTSGSSDSRIAEAGLENFEHYFTSVWNESNCVVVWTFFAIAFLWDWNENWPFPVLCPLLQKANICKKKNLIIQNVYFLCAPDNKTMLRNSRLRRNSFQVHKYYCLYLTSLLC